MNCDLVLVMPVYNEEECVVEVVESWREALSGLDIRFRIIVLNDGSTDNTQVSLQQFSNANWCEIINKANSGHGPTILQGYRHAVETAPWVFQCDSDNEMSPQHFATMWHHRNDYDAIFGVRDGRQQNAVRGFISSCSRLTVNLLFAKGVADVNVPYRLMRSQWLRPVIAQIPPDTFAPNVIIAGTFARAGLRIDNQRVPHQNRKTGQVSIMKWKLFKACVKSLIQTLRCRPVLHPSIASAEPLFNS